MNKLLDLLEKAHELSLEADGGYSDNFLTASEFQKSLRESIEKLRKQQNSADEIKKLRLWFAPSYDWDDFVGDVELGNEIYSQLSELEKPAGG